MDGLREVTPLDLFFLQELTCQGVGVLLTLPRPVPGLGEEIERLPERALEVRRFLLDNPVNEARFVLAEAARALEAGLHPAEVAVVIPEEFAPLYRENAASMGVPLSDELLRLVEMDRGAAALYEILSLVDHPTAGALARIEGLRPLAERLAAWEASSREALAVALREADEATRQRWEEVETLLTPLRPDPALVHRVLALAEQSENETALLQAGYRALTASGSGERAREWWRHLIERLRAKPRGEGITLTIPGRLAGRRYLRAFVAGATATRYTFSASEDFFFPEEERTALERVFEEKRLPYRFRDQAERFFEELAGAGEVTTITAHRTGTGGLEDPHPLLFPEDELSWASGPRPAHRAVYGPPRPRLDGFFPNTLGDLKSAELCATRYLYRNLLEEEREPSAFRKALDTASDPAELEEMLNFPPQMRGGILNTGQPVTFQLDGKKIWGRIPITVEKDGILYTVFPGYDYEPHPADVLAAIELTKTSRSAHLTVAVFRQQNKKTYPSRIYQNLPRDRLEKIRGRIETRALQALEQVRRGETLLSRIVPVCRNCNLEPICCKQSADRRKEMPE